MKCYDLMPAVLDEKTGTFKPLKEYAIRKTKLIFRDIKEIYEHNQDGNFWTLTNHSTNANLHNKRRSSQIYL